MDRREFFKQGATVISSKLLDQPIVNDLKSTVCGLKSQSKELGLEVAQIRDSIKENMINVNQQLKEIKSRQRGIIAAIVALAILG